MTREDEAPQSPAESLGSATRALAEATAALTKVLSNQVKDVVPEVGEVVASSLREASRGLAGASESVQRSTGRTARRKARADQTRADLLAAAARVIAEHGYEGATVDDIAADAGYTKGAVYAHFGSKEALFLTLAREQSVQCATDEALEAAGGLAGVYEESIRQGVGDHSMLLGLEVLAYGVRHPEARAELAPSVHEAFDVLAGQIRDERARRRTAAPGAGEEGSGAEGAPEPPTQDDRDTALALSAIASFAALYGTLELGEEDAVAAGSRLIRRLLGP